MKRKDKSGKGIELFTLCWTCQVGKRIIARREQKIRGAKENKHGQIKVWGRVKTEMMELSGLGWVTGSGTDENQG